MARVGDDDEAGVVHQLAHRLRLGHRGVGVLLADQQQHRHPGLAQGVAVVGPLGPRPQRRGGARGHGGAHHPAHVRGDLGHRGHVARCDHAVEHLGGVAVHALGEQPVGQRVAPGTPLLGLRDGRGVGEHQRGGPFRVEAVELHGDLTAHREPRHHGPRHSGEPEQRGQVLGVVPPPGHPRGHAARAVAAQVRQDHPVPGSDQGRGLRAPHAPVEGMAVHQEHRDAVRGTKVVVHQRHARADHGLPGAHLLASHRASRPGGTTGVP